MTCTAIAWVLVLIALPVIVLWSLTESKGIKIRRARNNGQTWAVIAKRYGVSPTTVRRWSVA